MNSNSLHNALDEIEQKVCSYRKDSNQELDGSVRNLLDSCDRAIFDIRVSCEERLSSFQSETNYNELINALAWTTIELPKYDESKMKDVQYKNEKYEYIEATFPQWNTLCLDKCLSTDMKEAMSLLPYILTTYYFNSIASVVVFPKKVHLSLNMGIQINTIIGPSEAYFRNYLLNTT